MASANKAEYKKRMAETKQKIKDGTWFLDFIKKEVNKAIESDKLSQFKSKYKNLNNDEIALKIIGHYAMKTTGVGLATGLLAGFVAAASIIPDVIAVTRMQIHMLTYLAILYEKIDGINLNYPEPFLRIFAVVVGGWNSKAFSTQIIHHETSRDYEALKNISKRLGRRILTLGTVTKGIPIISSAAGGTLNFIRTQRLGKYALLEFKGKTAAEKFFSIYGFNEIDFRKELMLSVITMMKCDEDVSDEKIHLFGNILMELQLTKPQREELLLILSSDEPIYFLDFTQIQTDEQKTFLIHTLIRTSLSDGTYKRKEERYIKKVCKTLKIPYKKNMIDDFKNTSEYHEYLRAYSRYIQDLDSP